MKFPLWLVAIPIVGVFTVFQLTFDLGEQGRLDSPFLRENIYSFTRSVNGAMTNFKFKIRGPEKPKQKIVIIAADDYSVANIGRWPWHRDIYALLFHSAFKLGVKYMGIDTVFSEEENRIPKEAYEAIKGKNPKLAEQLKQFESDPQLAQVFEHYKDRIVLGYTPNKTCQPRYADKPEDCPVGNEELNKEVQESISKFALGEDIPLSLDTIHKTSMSVMLTGVFNIPLFRDAADHAGHFGVDPDSDGYIRRYPLFAVNQNKLFPALALELAALVNNDTVKVKFTNDARIERVYFSKEETNPIPVTRLAYIDLNFRGPAQSFTYVSANDILIAANGDDEKLKAEIQDKLSGSIALFGVTAIGLYDMRAFPFDSNTAGVEGHATALDNLLSGDELRSASSIQKDWLPISLLILLGLLFAILFSRFEAIPSLLVFAGFNALLGFVDITYLFHNNINLPTGFLVLEISVIFAVILSLRYIIEERNKKHIKSAFSHYLAPSVVEMVLKDPSKLTVGGERKELSILFSDLRGFTTLSEKLEPKLLSQFLNEYLTEMTEIIFEYGGTLDKYIGDAVMAFWGAPLEQSDHAVRACLAGIKMQKRILEIAPYFKEKYGAEVSMGVGINSGVVSVGNMGSKRIFEYTVIGDHVNLASRLESLTRLYGTGILSTRYTLDALPAEFKSQIHYRVLDVVKVKGKSNAADLIEILPEAINEKALELFYLAKDDLKRRKWDDATALFKKSNELYQQQFGTEDPVCAIFIERIEVFIKNPPPEGWDGTIEMRSK